MGELDNSATVEITGKIMVVAIVILFIVVVFVLFLHLYAKWFWWRTEEPTHPPSRRNRRRFIFNPGQEPVRTGLELSVLRSLPIVIFQSEDFKDGLECSVCLSEVLQGEKTRLLPKCNHGFHVDCIDMWFQYHSTCPLCRNSVAPKIEIPNFDSDDLEHNVHVQGEDVSVPGFSSESPNFPTNVLFWGDQSQVSSANQEDQAASSSSSSGNNHRESEMLVIDIPLQMSENFGGEEEAKSPMPTQRLRSLKRLLSREKRVAPSTSTTSP
ncbi:RING/U-box superfamily protein [Euphorbia peplus]|nr:RING/U-box superfamily protein [Euphorbia peplus]